MEKEIISPTESRKAWVGVPGFTTFDEPVIVRTTVLHFEVESIRSSFFSRTQYFFIRCVIK